MNGTEWKPGCAATNELERALVVGAPARLQRAATAPARHVRARVLLWLELRRRKLVRHDVHVVCARAKQNKTTLESCKIDKPALLIQYTVSTNPLVLTVKSNPINNAEEILYCTLVSESKSKSPPTTRSLSSRDERPNTLSCSPASSM